MSIQSALFHGVSTTPLSLEPARRTISKTSWDTINRSYLIDAAAIGIDATIAANFPEGQTHSEHSGMFVYRTTPLDQGGGVYQIDVEWKGIIIDKGYRRKLKVFGETSSGENVTIAVTGYPTFAKKIKVEQPVLSVETTYHRTGAPSMSGVKQSGGTLPVGFPGLPTPPAQVWTSIPDPTVVYPSGWILDDRDSQQLPGTDRYLVTDRHVYRFQTEM